MNLYLTRSFDRSGYYETRFLLTLCVLALVGYLAIRKKDRNYLVLFLSGVLWQALMEYRLISGGLRGSSYGLSFFGVQLPGSVSWLFQGLFEGGLITVLSYAFLDTFRLHRGDLVRRRLYLGMCALIVILASSVGWMARGHAITSARPMFAPGSIFTGFAWIWLSLLLAWWKGGEMFRWLGWYYWGTVVYVLLTFEPLHLLGVRYVAVKDAAGHYAAASGLDQWRWILWSHLYEVAGTKIYYFAIPAALGLVRLPRGKS
ncbi:MAG: hypothetical protein HY235_20090 [Acidobacteria bacterium]|nr:hypothetical protein [Acidobacteriota bacterium]